MPWYCEQSYHLFYLLFPDLEERQRFIAYLQARNIASVFHYVPLHTSEMGQKFGARAGDCPVTEEISDRLVRLPFYNSLSQTDQDRVIDSILQFYEPSKSLTVSIAALTHVNQTASRSSAVGVVHTSSLGNDVNQRFKLHSRAMLGPEKP